MPTVFLIRATKCARHTHKLRKERVSLPHARCKRSLAGGDMGQGRVSGGIRAFRNVKGLGVEGC